MKWYPPDPWSYSHLLIVDRFPHEFLRGLLHSDGCRTANRFQTRPPSGRVAEYVYPRWFFERSRECAVSVVMRLTTLGAWCRGPVASGGLAPSGPARRSGRSPPAWGASNLGGFTVHTQGAGMAITAPEPSRGGSLDPATYAAHQRTARIFGVLFALTFVTSIAAVVLYQPVLDDADFILGAGAETRVQLGALCEILLAIANIGTAVVLFPIARRQSEGVALGYVASRVVESTVIVVGLISLLSVLTLREDFAGAGADAGSLTIAGQSLVAVHDFTFLLGPGFCVGVNGLLLGYLFYTSGLVPRRIALFGLVGGPLIFASSIAVLFGAYEQDGAHFLFSIPEIIFEFSITVFTIWKGFRADASVFAR
jgi:Domain of unknown function (DUF4386)